MIKFTSNGLQRRSRAPNIAGLTVIIKGSEATGGNTSLQDKVKLGERRRANEEEEDYITEKGGTKICK